jgi:hypothetical protein
MVIYCHFSTLEKRQPLVERKNKFKEGKIVTKHPNFECDGQKVVS